MSVLSVRGLGKCFGPVRAVDDVSFDVSEASRTAVVGPSGSGKTTLLRLVTGFEAPDSGEIRLDGQLIADKVQGVPAHRRNIGLVMQEGALFPHLSVVENIRFGIRDQPDADDRALALMDLVELERAMAGRHPHQISGGQQQRVALARALARRPRLMLLDEPLSALDTSLREQLRGATRQILADAGIATILVTHDQEEAMSFADQLLVLREGRLVQAGRPHDLYLAPADPLTAAFLGPAVIMDAEIQGEVARCALGDLPVSGERLPSSGPVRIMLRPEQIGISPGTGDTAGWLLQSVEPAGPLARVTVKPVASRLSAAPAGSLTFKTASAGLPREGSAVVLTVCGPAYVFGN